MIQVRAYFDDVLWFQFSDFRNRLCFIYGVVKPPLVGLFDTGVLRQSKVAHWILVDYSVVPLVGPEPIERELIPLFYKRGDQALRREVCLW